MSDLRPNALQYTGVGFQFMVEAALLALLGWWGDGKLDTAPWLLASGAMIGVALATFNLIRNVDRLGRSEGETSENP